MEETGNSISLERLLRAGRVEEYGHVGGNIAVINLTRPRGEASPVWLAGRAAANEGRRIKRKMETDYGATSRSIGG